MKIIAVDDEPLALKSIERALLKALPEADLMLLDTPSKALQYAEENQVDVAFLDIEMGGMNGLMLAKALKDIYPKTNIVFATGYSEYALDAFSIHASGYLMKPVKSEAILTSMDNLRNPLRVPSDKPIRIQTFGNFEVFANSEPIKFARTKTKELLAYLTCRQGAFCTNNEAIAVIWEDKSDCASLQSQLRHLVADMTNALKEANAEDILIKRRGTLAIVPGKISCDFYDFCNGDSGAVNSYAGEFMAQYSWAEFTNAYLSRRQGM